MYTKLCLTMATLTCLAAPVTAQELRPMLRVDWREGPEYPLGIQDAVIGVVGSQVVAAGGFTRWPKDVLQLHPDAFGGEPSGFTSLTFAFDPAHAAAGWRRLPNMPGPPRQGAAYAVVGEALYAVGGFNYTAPLTYGETCRLRRDGGGWTWEELPCPLPFPVCEASAVAVGHRLYLCAAADYFLAPDATQADFHSQAGRTGDAVGRALLMLDTTDLARGWIRLADKPGTPVFDAAVAAVGGKIWVLGGIYAPLHPRPDEGPYYNAIDSWVYDPTTDRWAQLSDMPHGANRRAVPFADRYILLLAGYKYGRTWHSDGTVSEVYTAEERQRDWKSFFQRTVLVYDTVTGKLGTAHPLLDQTSWPSATISGDTIYCLGGEGGERLWHPATFQIGKVSAREP